MTESPDVIAVAMVERIRREAKEEGRKEGKAEGFKLGWNACVAKMNAATKAVPSPPRTIAKTKSRTTPDTQKAIYVPSADEYRIQQWIKLGKSAAPEASRTYWELFQDFIDKREEPIETLELQIKAFCTLKRELIHTIGDITQKSLSDFFEIRNFGEMSFRDLYATMANKGYGLVTREE